MLCGLLLFKFPLEILGCRWYWIVAVDVYLNNALIQLLYLLLANFTASHLRLDCKQLVWEFLQDALSKKAR